MHKKLALLLVCIAVIIPILLFSGCNESADKPPEGEEVPGGNSSLPEDEEQLEKERIETERRQKEEDLRRRLGKFFVPLPSAEKKNNPSVKAKGIYVTGNTVGLERKFNELLELIKSTELNSIVMDVKNDHGLMSYDSDIEIVNEIGADKNVPVKDIARVMYTLEENDIYPIARIVVFKDPYLPEHYPEWAIQRADGSGVWREKGVAWVNPYRKEVWDYNIAIAKEAALLGFREIQFDYVRFPENAGRLDKEAVYPGENGAKDDTVQAFLAYAREQLQDYNVYLAADVFGVIATSWGDSDRIGQTWEKISSTVDISCPMIYPSHYGQGYFGYAVPDANPGGVITRALQDAITRNAPLENPSVIRPWLQSFTAAWVKGNINYGPEEVREQIEAALALDIDQFLIWNPGNNYYSQAFLTDMQAVNLASEMQQKRTDKGLDALHRTAEEALDSYLTAVRRKRWRDVFALQSTDFQLDYEELINWLNEWSGDVKHYKIVAADISSDKAKLELDIGISVGGNNYEMKNDKWELLLENNIWRVKPSLYFTEMLTFTPS